MGKSISSMVHRHSDGANWNSSFQVAPLELEEIILRHPAVHDAAVCGVWSDEAATDLVRAYVVLRDGYNRDASTAKSIAEFLAGQTSGYKHLRGGVIFLDELPKSPTGKILRRLLKDIGKGQTSKPMARL